MKSKNNEENKIEKAQEKLPKKSPKKITKETPTDLGLAGIKKAFNKEIASSNTKFHKGALRSGNKIEHEGSIVVIGDVNHGSEIIAGDNIVVLGALRGIAHAGAKGNKKAIIAATSIESPQIRISKIIKEIEREDIEETKTYAYVEGENIVLE